MGQLHQNPFLTLEIPSINFKSSQIKAMKKDKMSILLVLAIDSKKRIPNILNKISGKFSKYFHKFLTKNYKKCVSFLTIKTNFSTDLPLV
jgi:hypothetical protein